MPTSSRPPRRETAPARPGCSGRQSAPAGAGCAEPPAVAAAASFVPSPAETKALLASAALFRDLPPAALDEIAAYLEWRVVAAGATLCAQGEPGEFLLLVACGRLEAFRELPGGGERPLREVGPGETVGELAVFADRPRSATVRAVRDSVVALLSRKKVAALVERHPAVLRQATLLAVDWLEGKPAPAAAPGCTTIAVVPAAGLLPALSLTEGLAAMLSRLGPTRVVDARCVDAYCGAGAANSPDGSRRHGLVTRWLAGEERAHRFLIYRADAPDAWARRAARQADRILVVAAAGAAPELGPARAVLEHAARGARQGREELVLLHANGARARETARWLALYPFRAHHHVRRGAPEDVGRLVRRVSRGGVGLVLGGGGARGFAHIGVIRALEEAGVPVDRIGGASMGAVIAAQRAYGYSWREMVEVNRRGWIGMAPHKVYTMPLVSLLSRPRSLAMLEMMFGDVHIEDLPTSFFCVSTNLTRTEVVVFRQGLLRDALIASTAIPGITPPAVAAGGELLVDGGVLNNMPIDVMRRQGDGPIVASDVSAMLDLRADPAWAEAPTPWQLLAGRLRRGRSPRPFPNILNLVTRAAVLASNVHAREKRGEVDLYLDLPMASYGMFDVDRLDEIVEYGYRFAREALAASPGLAALGEAAPASFPPAA